MVAEVVQNSEQPQQTTADHASLALLRVHRPRVGKTAHRALLTVTHAQLVTRAIHVTHVRQPVATSVATGAQHLLLAAATFSAMTVHHAELAKTVRLALLIVTHAHRATRVTVAHLVALKTVRLAPLTVTHDHRATVTHAQQELLTAQNHADLASSMTALASSTATTATTAPTVVQTVLTA